MHILLYEKRLGLLPTKFYQRKKLAVDKIDSYVNLVRIERYSDK